METHGILIVGIILLCGGCSGFAVVRLSNPGLKGLGWLGCAFAAGALGAGGLALRDARIGHVSILVPDTLFLLAYVLLQVCLRELLEHKRRLPRMGAGLLALQAVAYVFLHRTARAAQLNLVVFGVVMAVQAAANIYQLQRAETRGIRAPVRYLMVLLLAFAGFNLVRSVVVLSVGVPREARLPNPLEVEAAVVYLSAALGIGFGVFWMTSGQLRLILEEQANTDPLTGVANRRAFLLACEHEFQRSVRTGESFSLILLDIDHFKRINDVYGHGMGDKVLREAVDRMRRSLRNIDVLGRWGGEEFVALLPGAGAEMAHRVAERLRGSVESLKVANTRATRGGGAAIGAAAIGATVSIGVASYAGDMPTLDELFALCDRALYEAKASGRNRIVCAEVPQKSFPDSLRSLA